MKWFKHYSNAQESNALTEIFAEYGFEGYGRYWALLELMCKKFDGENDEKFVFRKKDLMDILGYYHANSMRKYLQCIANVGLMSFEWEKNVVRIHSDILLRLQGRDYKKARSTRGRAAPKKENKDIRIKKGDIPPSFLDNIIKLWNSELGDLTSSAVAASSKTAKEFGKLKGRFDTLEKWSEYFTQIKQSDFLLGKNDKKWVVNFDWAMNEDNAIKVLNGNYKNKVSKSREMTPEELDW